MHGLLEASSYTWSALTLPIAGVGVLAVAVGLFVLWHERASRASVSFGLASLAVAVYMAGFSVMVRAGVPDVALFWGRFAYLGIPFIVPAVYQFSMDLLGLRDRRRGLVRLAWAVGALHAVLAVGTDILVPGVRELSWGYITRITLAHVLFVLWSIVLLVLTLRDYLRQYREAPPVQQARIQLFAIPLLIASIGFVDYAPSLGADVPPFGFVVLAVFLASAAWAVARYHLPTLTPAFAADQIIRTMAEPLLVCDDRATIAFANPAAARLFGWTETELVGKELAHVFGPDAAATTQERVGLGAFEREVSNRLGEPVALSISSSRIQVKRGQEVGIVVVARDIRERKRAAEELRRREQHYRALIEHARDTITILDGAGTILYESPATRETLGYAPSESVGQDVFQRVHPHDRAVARQRFDEVLNRPNAAVDVECRLRTTSGDYRVFDLHGRNLLENPAVHGVVVNGRDVTEERQLAVQLQQSQKMEAIGRLAGGVAHDFNNVLTAIQGNVALLLEAVSEEALREDLEEVREGADRAARLTDQLLAFSRRQVVRSETLSLNETVTGMQAMLSRLIGERIDLRIRTDANPDLVRVDRGQLEQVVMNLVVNARDALSEGGRIILGTSVTDVDPATARRADFQLEPGEYVLLEVTDNGDGMDGETRSRIFEPFFTTKGPSEGTGLGLSTVYGSVRQANGYIGVASRPGHGTTFSIYLPRAEDDAGTPTRPSEAAPDVRADGLTVLVVEDEAPVRSLVARILERRGYHVLQAETGEQALEVAGGADGEVHLLIADLVMPGISGREVADQLSETHPGMASVLISGYTADEAVRQGIDAGEREFLAKPFTPADLLAKVGEVLAQR